MNQKTEKDIALYYLNNIVRQPMDSELEDRVCDWFEKNACQLIGQEIEDLWEGRHRSFGRRHVEDKQNLPRRCQTIRELLDGKPGRLPNTPEVSAIIKAFHFSPEYHDAVALYIHMVGIPLLDSLINNYSRGTDSKRQIIAAMLDMPLRRYEKLLSSTSELIEKGLLENRGRNGGRDITGMFYEVVLDQCETPEAVKRVVLGKPQKASLTPDHFEHLQEDYNWLRNLLTNALAKKWHGVNILIYGKPGTGKTELAKTLCKEIGSSLYAVSGNLSEERNGIGRRSDLAAALCLLQGDQNSVLLMDEAEDVFGTHRSFSFLGFSMSDSDSSGSKSKLFFNKLLESNAVPVVWISNSVKNVDPSHLRRFSYALKMEAPDETVQSRIWDSSARRNKVKLPKGKIDNLVKSYDIAPAIINASLRTAALTGDHNAIEKTIDSLQTAMYGKSEKKATCSEHEFLTDLLNCNTNLENLTQRIIKLKNVSFSLCLYGAPGTGKSAYARFLAEKLKMKVLHKRASELFDPFVGVTEQKIAAAFAEARRKKMLLIFDEADSFLRDRHYAQQNFEVAWVNEMLTQMESHPLPFVCTTNLMDDLDKASLRRFTFKVKYDFLTQKQIKSAFKHFFGTESMASLHDLTHLSPGDFAVVAKKAKICGVDDHKELVVMLRQEQEVKDVKSNSIGFGT